MSQDFTPAAAARFGIGNVLGTSASVLARNIIPFGIISALAILPSGLIEWFYEPNALDGEITTAGQDGWIIGLSALLSVICNGIATGALVYGTFQDLRGQRAGIGACIGRAAATLLPIVIASIGFGLMVGVGTLLLIVPGIILYVVFWLYAPAIIVERAGIGASFSRSADLTRGRRWPIFGLLLVIYILIIVAMMAFTFIGGVTFALISPVAFLIVLYLVQALTTAYLAVATAVTYYYLRADKEGVDIEDIAKLFD